MARKNVAELTLGSEGGVYEIFVLSGKTYEAHLPPGNTAPFLLISEDAGEPDEVLGRDSLLLLELEAQLGAPAELIVVDPEDGASPRRVQTAEVVSIVKV